MSRIRSHVVCSGLVLIAKRTGFSSKPAPGRPAPLQLPLPLTLTPGGSEGRPPDGHNFSGPGGSIPGGSIPGAPPG
jgi:hypothetical protein